jgi:hypothetical protein
MRCPVDPLSMELTESVERVECVESVESMESGRWLGDSIDSMFPWTPVYASPCLRPRACALSGAAARQFDGRRLAAAGPSRWQRHRPLNPAQLLRLRTMANGNPRPTPREVLP